jgi:hypothetical protein
MMPFSSNASASLQLRDALLDAAGTAAHFERGDGEEAAAWETPPLQVVEERVAHRYEAADAGFGLQGAGGHLLVEDAARLLDGRQL